MKLNTRILAIAFSSLAIADFADYAAINQQLKTKSSPQRTDK